MDLSMPMLKTAQTADDLAISVYIGEDDYSDDYHARVEEQVLAIYPDAIITIYPTAEDMMQGSAKAYRNGAEDFEVSNAVQLILEEVFTSLYGGTY